MLKRGGILGMMVVAVPSLVLFFFSSRRRHTRLTCDWSSDVCSSDLDTLRTALANLESDFAVLLARRLDRPREAKKLLATLFAAPGTIHVGSRAVTVRDRKSVV